MGEAWHRTKRFYERYWRDADYSLHWRALKLAVELHVAILGLLLSLPFVVLFPPSAFALLGYIEGLKERINQLLRDLGLPELREDGRGRKANLARPLLHMLALGLGITVLLWWVWRA